MGLCILFLHNLAPLVPGSENGIFKQALMPLFAPTAYQLGNGRLFIIGYPPVPWLGIMLVGFACGRFFELEIKKTTIDIFKDRSCRHRIISAAPVHKCIWGSCSLDASEKRVVHFSFFYNVTKYPPSLQFSLLFLGLMFLILASIAGIKSKWTEFVCIYGKVPLFYFVLHWYLIHPLVFLMVFLQGFKSSDMVFGFNFGRPKTGSGIPLWAVYLVWIGIVLAMYPLCKWYGRYKERNKGKMWVRLL